jgi:hypothetical protein
MSYKFSVKIVFIRSHLLIRLPRSNLCNQVKKSSQNSTEKNGGIKDADGEFSKRLSRPASIL